MKITIYELLGMIKDDKAPKKVKYKDFIYEYYEQETVIDYRCYDEKTELYGYLSSYVDYETFNILDNEVEILEEEKEIPEKLKIEQDTPRSNYYIRNEYGTKCGLTKHSKIIADKLNEIIDYLKSKGE